VTGLCFEVIKDHTLLLRLRLKLCLDGSIEVLVLLKFKLEAVYKEKRVFSKLKDVFSQVSNFDFDLRQSLLTILS